MDLIQSINAKEKTLEEQVVDLSPLGLGPWSYSKVKVLEKCPFQFYLKYILKVKAPQAPVSLVTEVGKAAHKILELAITGKGIADSFRLTKAEYSGVVPSDHWEENVVTLEYSITKFMQRLDEFQSKHPVKRFLQEIRMGVTKEWEPTGFFSEDVYYRSVIDLAIQLESKDVIIIDHKTGAPALSGLRNYKDQLNTYKVMFHHGIEPVKGAQSGINFIRDGELLLDEYTESKAIESRLKGNIQASIDGAIQGSLNAGYFKHKACNLCKYCEFEGPCKSGELKDIEKKTIRFFPKEKINE